MATGDEIRLRPVIALLLADPLPADAGPGVATRAIGAAFVAAQLAGPDADTERLVLADCPIDLPLTGPITVWSGAGPGETCPPEEFGDLIGRLIALADARGGLAAGELAAFGTLTPGTGLLVGSDTVALWGPGSSALNIGARQ